MLDISSFYTCVRKNYNHMRWSFWNTECTRPNSLLFWAIFCPFTPLMTHKIFKKRKKHRRHYPFTNAYNKWRSFNIWLLRYKAQQNCDFGDFNIHQKDWLTYSGRTDRSGKLSYSDPWLWLSVLLFWIYFFLPTLVFILKWLPSIGKFCSRCSLSFHWLSNKLKAQCPFSSQSLWLVLIGMLHGRISLNSVLLLLLVKFVGGLRLGLMYISLAGSIRSNLCHLHGFQQLVLLP